MEAAWISRLWPKHLRCRLCSHPWPRSLPRMPAWCSQCPARTSALSALESEFPKESRLPSKSRSFRQSQWLTSRGKQITGRCLPTKALRMSSAAFYIAPKIQSTQVSCNVTNMPQMTKVVDISDSQRASLSKTKTSPNLKMAVKNSWRHCLRTNQKTSFIKFETARRLQKIVTMRSSMTR